MIIKKWSSDVLAEDKGNIEREASLEVMVKVDVMTQVCI